MAKRPQQEEFDRDILDIIPERYDADEDAYDSHSGSRLRTIVTVMVALIAVGIIVAIGWRMMGTRHMGPATSQVIKADDHAVKVRPDDRGGMQVPNQDKLVYGRMENEGGDATKTERLLAPPEEPQSPPRPGSVMPPPAPMPIAVAPPPVPVPVPVQAEPPPVAHQPPAHLAPPPSPAPKMALEPPAPQVAAIAPAPAPAVHKTVAESGGSYLVQLGAVRSADAADKEWSRIQHGNAELLSGLKPDIVQVNIPDKGTFWRIRAGSLSEQGARQLCQQLASRNQGCILVHK